MSKDWSDEHQQRPTSATGGFTLVELALVVVMIGILAAIMTPRIAAVLHRTSAAQAAGVVSTELEQAVSLAMRLRVPVRVSCDCPNGTLVLTNRNTGAVLRRRAVAGVTEGFQVQSLALSPTTVDVYPSGVTSAPLTVSLASSTRTRQVTLSTAGFARVLP